MNAMTCYAHDLQCKCLRNTGVLQPACVGKSRRLLFLALVPTGPDAACTAALAAPPPKHGRRTHAGSQPWHRRPHLDRAQTRRTCPSSRAEVRRCGRSSPLVVLPLPLPCHGCPCPSLSPSCFSLPPQWIRWIMLLSYLRVGG
jgi:hypothetical protein